jgi:type I restriction enzyme S subunit
MELMNGYKQTEVGVIPIDWEVTNISTSSTLKARIGWQGLKKSEYLNYGDYFLITGTDFEDGKIKWETCHYVTKDRYNQDKNIQLQINDILITKDGTIGKVAYINKLPLAATLNSGIFVLRPKNNSYNPLYCYYIFKSQYFEKFLSELVAGSTINHLYQKDFVLFNFPIPSNFAEQIAIADALKDIDELISSLEKFIDKKKDIKQGLVQRLLKPKNGWTEKTIGDIGKVKMCKRVFNYQTHKEGVIPFYKIGTFGKEPDAYISLDLYNNFRQKFSFPKIGEILISAAGTIGRTIVYDGTPSYFQDSNIVWIDNDESLVTNKFLYHILQITKYKTEGGTIQRLYNSILKSTKFICPPKAEQTEIVNILTDMDAEIELTEKKLFKIKMLQEGMMQNLLTGKIRLV